ncbi:hypothetical protein [Methylobacterium longum]|uniref:Uncharacterized protein n=1 Tax=Methylobacterium longum TaxID=767694 RepID=A0ABT8AWX0_9HYPH|nr:hypothetical protein [Methylobacterium longum]MDN3573824.1 hypothetical protein [Methylobacterium longum]
MTEQRHTLNYVLDMASRLADQFLQLTLHGRAAPDQMISTLLDVATMLRENGIEWPTSLDSAIKSLHADAVMLRKKPNLLGNLRGFVDRATHAEVVGWALNQGAPDYPVELEILVNGALIATLNADLMRPGLAAAIGMGDGRQGFNYAFNPKLEPQKVYKITVRRRPDGAILGEADIS